MNVLIIAVLLFVLVLFYQGYMIFLWYLPQEKFKTNKWLMDHHFMGWILISYILVSSFSLAGFCWFARELINCIKIR